MNKFVKTMCFIGGANLDILQKCPTEKNGFIATGIGIINVVLLSIVAMSMVLYNIFKSNGILSVFIALFYGFIVFVGYWGILSVIRRSVRYAGGMKLFGIIATVLIALISTYALGRYVIKYDNVFQKIDVALGNI